MGGGRDYRDFLSEFFRLSVPKNFLGGPFSVTLKSGTKNFLPKEGISRFAI